VGGTAEDPGVVRRADVIAFGRRVKKFLRTEEGLAIIDSSKVTVGTSWDEGGCWALARALHAVLPGSTMMSIWNVWDKQDHVVVEYDGLFLDAHGAATAEQLIRRAREDSGAVREPWIGSFDPKQAKDELVCPAGVVRRLTVEFRRLL
jgi:hypothetical protein